MSDNITQLYGKNHWDDGNYASLRDYYQDQLWRRGLEIGFAWSMSARAFLDALPEATLLSLDDNDNMERADQMATEYGPRWAIQYGDSSSLMKQLTETFDYIYIDGDHSHEGVTKDLAQAPRLLAPGGSIICDDYDNAEAIRRAVSEFQEAYGFYTVGQVPRNNNGAIVLKAKE